MDMRQNKKKKLQIPPGRVGNGGRPRFQPRRPPPPPPRRFAFPRIEFSEGIILSVL